MQPYSTNISSQDDEVRCGPVEQRLRSGLPSVRPREKAEEMPDVPSESP